MESKVNVLHGCNPFHTEYVVPTLLSASKPKQTCFITVAQVLSCAVRCFHLSISISALHNGGLELYQNVPNPKERSTEISFRIMGPGLAKLSVINLLGETVYMHERRYEAGVHSISWNTNQGSRSAPPGVYLYRLESNGQELIKKMLIK